MTDLYNVVIKGSVIPGWKNQEVIKNLMAAFKITHEKAEYLLSGKPSIVKKNIDQENALKFSHVIGNAGADCEIVRAGAQSLKLEIDGERNGIEITCPKCGHRQPERKDCIQCGIVFSKYREDSKNTSNSVSEDTQVSKETTLENDLSSFIVKNTHKYLYKFNKYKLHQGSYAITWNWAAFFLTAWWFAYRKLYMWTFISIVVGAILNAISPLLSLLYLIIIGSSANFIYYRHSINKIKVLRARYPKENINNKLSMAGGTSMKLPTAIGAFVLFSIVMAIALPVFLGYKANAMTVEIDRKAILRPTFYCTEGEYKAGTAFVVKMPESGQNILITAHHLFSPFGGFKKAYNWDEIENLVQKVEATSIIDIYSWVETSEVLPIVGGQSFDGKSACNDLAAFPLVNESGVPALSLAEKLPRRFETVWLFAEVQNKDSEKNLYPARVVSVEDKSITFVFNDSTLDLTATSGAPVLNRNGEVIALNVAGAEQDGRLFGVGNPSIKIREMILKSLKN